jgi:hypothetical protein
LLALVLSRLLLHILFQHVTRQLFMLLLVLLEQGLQSHRRLRRYRGIQVALLRYALAKDTYSFLVFILVLAESFRELADLIFELHQARKLSVAAMGLLQDLLVQLRSWQRCDFGAIGRAIGCI